MSDDKRTHQVSLGCGTLILIALIVLIFSGHGTRDLTREVHELRSKVGELKKSIEEQTAEIKSLQQKLERQQALEK
jgi:Sec-independent protein translocase protein TatA